MNNLIDYKSYLTISETAKYLTDNVFLETTSEADVLQFASDELLTISVNISQPLNVMVWKGEQDGQALLPEPSMIVGLHDLSLDFGNGALELMYRLKVLHNGNSDKPDKSASYVLDNHELAYELPANYDLDLVVRSSAIRDFQSYVIEIEREKAVAQIKASRTSATLSANDLLETTIAGLIEEIRPEDNFSKYFELYIWKELLDKEKLRVTSAPYSDEMRREDRLSLIRKKAKEVDWHLADCPQKNISEQTITSPTEHFNKPTLPSKSTYQVQELIHRWINLFGKPVTDSDILQWAIDGKYNIYVANNGLRQVNLHTKAVLGQPSRKIIAYLDNTFIKLKDFQLQELLSGNKLEITLLDITQSDFVQGDEPFKVLDIERAVLEKSNRINISPTDIKYLSVMGDEVLGFEKVALAPGSETANNSFPSNYETEINTSKVATTKQLMKGSPSEQDKRLDDLEEFIDLLQKAAKPLVSE